MRRIHILGLLVSLTACGGGEATDEEPTPVATTGDEAPAESPARNAPADEPPPAPPPSGPGQLTVQVEAGGNEVSATVRVVDSGGDTVAEGQAGQTFALEAGQYRVYAAIGDDSVLIDTPTREYDGRAVVSPGDTEEVTVEFGIARVRLDVRRGGRSVARWSARVRRQGGMSGDEEIELTPSEDHVAISPGRYDATLTLGGEQISVNGLIFQGGATQTVPVNVN
ncbi:MAG: hypothetical protein AB8I08_29695 [Sandaracinaceae bacterium]